ncbi:MAG: LuxR C-terminal-related transcriptional regulator [Burkholderiaceae bacterium]
MITSPPSPVLLKTLSGIGAVVGSAIDQTPPHAGGARVQMTERQRQVLVCVVRGMSNKAIARSMCLSESTIKQHLSSVFKLLGVNTRTQAVLAATRLGLQAVDRAPGDGVIGRMAPPADIEMLGSDS